MSTTTIMITGTPTPIPIYAVVGNPPVPKQILSINDNHYNIPASVVDDGVVGKSVVFVMILVPINIIRCESHN